MSKIINTRADLNALAISDPAAHAEFVKYMKGALTQKADVQVYPEGYDHTPKTGDTGYIAPLLGDIETDKVAVRFGFSRTKLLSLATES